MLGYSAWVGDTRVPVHMVWHPPAHAFLRGELPATGFPGIGYDITKAGLHHETYFG